MKAVNIYTHIKRKMHIGTTTVLVFEHKKNSVPLTSLRCTCVKYFTSPSLDCIITNVHWMLILALDVSVFPM